MFFKQVWRNAAKVRKGNGLFFGSLVIAIVAFYTLLSLDKQDVIYFLSEIESVAVQKLLAMLPLIYVVSLFFMFFLVYFACKYQTDSRHKELGMYLMLGMKRSRLFFMLFCETLWNSVVSLIIGLPIAIFLTEIISLATAKIVGLGILNHHFSVSPNAILWTICGFIIIELISMLIICIPLSKAEPAKLLNSNAAEKQIKMTTSKSLLFFIAGILLLLRAYYLGISCFSDFEIIITFKILLSGILGTFCFYKGFGGFLGKIISKNSVNSKGLKVFSGRQIQENVISQYKSLAVSSLLLIMALSCISFGIGIGVGNTKSSHSTDFSLFGAESEIEEFCKIDDIKDIIKDCYPIYLSLIKAELDVSNIEETFDKIKKKNDFLFRINYAISEGSYNRMMRSMEKKEINLSGNKVALYTSITDDNHYAMISDLAEKSSFVGINGVNYEIDSNLYYDNIVADRAITLGAALIVPDDLYLSIASKTAPYCWNIYLKDEITKDLSLMQTIKNMEEKIKESGLKYDSFFKGIGRNLFYSVATSYLTVYLGIIFLIIANTVIGMKYLISHRQNKHRYVTLFMLGASMDEVCSSVLSQIQTFFYLVLGVSLVSSVIAIITMFTSIFRISARTSLPMTLAFSSIAFAAFTLAEIIYISIVKRVAFREIRSFQIIDRE